MLRRASQNNDPYRGATQRCNVCPLFARIFSLLARRRGRQPLQRVYWPKNVIDRPEQWRSTCVTRHARAQKLQRLLCGAISTTLFSHAELIMVAVSVFGHINDQRGLYNSFMVYGVTPLYFVIQIIKLNI